MFWLIVLTIVLVYLFQTILGLRQAKHFAFAFTALRRRGRVAIGKRQGLLTAGAIVMFLLDDRGRIVDGRRMTGVTVLARFREFPDLNGQQIDSLAPEQDRRHPRSLRHAIANARDNFTIITAGGIAAEPPTPFARLTDRVRALFKRSTPISA